MVFYTPESPQATPAFLPRSDYHPAVDEVKIFAPGTVANLGPGFDVLGLALDHPGDTVTARRAGSPGVRIASIQGDAGVLPLEPQKNTAGIAAIEVVRRAKASIGANSHVYILQRLPSLCLSFH